MNWYAVCFCSRVGSVALLLDTTFPVLPCLMEQTRRGVLADQPSSSTLALGCVAREGTLRANLARVGGTDSVGGFMEFAPRKPGQDKIYTTLPPQIHYLAFSCLQFPVIRFKKRNSDIAVADRLLEFSCYRFPVTR